MYMKDYQRTKRDLILKLCCPFTFNNFRHINTHRENEVIMANSIISFKSSFFLNQTT